MTTAHASWRAEADARIEKHRKGEFTLQFLDADGEPLAATELAIVQTKSSFGFGTCISDDLMSVDSADALKYRQFILQHFNMLVCENAMKWYATEKERGDSSFAGADRAAQYAAEHGFNLRGHCLFWAKPKFVQEWLQRLNPDELRRAMEIHLEAMVPRYAGRLLCWDVNNEMLDGSFYEERLGPGIHPWMFRRASELDPNARLFTNEYGILASEEKLERYIELIAALLKQGAPVGGIGVQEHAAERFAAKPAPAMDNRDERAGNSGLVPEIVWERLDRLAALGLPIHLTEISAKTDDLQQRAEGLEMLFRVGFAHPGVEAILLWGFWEKAHWLGPQAALVDADWRLLPAGERISKLLLDEWRTNLKSPTDATGTLRFRGFFGTYAVTAVSPDGKKLSGTISLSVDAPNATIHLQ